MIEPQENCGRDGGEAGWVQAAQKGDLRAFEWLIEEHLDAIRAFIGLKLPVAHLIDEIAHETFVFAHRRLAGFEAGTSFRRWLRAIAANLIRAELQRFSREQANRLAYARHQLLESALDTGNAAASDETEHLRQCVEDLPSNLADLVRMKYTEELSTEEMASRLGRSPNAVWQALFRLRQQIRQCLERRLAGKHA